MLFCDCFTAKKYEELHPKQQKKSKEKGKDAENEKKKESKKAESAQKPKESKPEESAPAKEKKDPFGDLPPPKMVFDEWKKMYRNNDTATVAIPWFWENIDKEGKHLFVYGKRVVARGDEAHCFEKVDVYDVSLSLKYRNLKPSFLVKQCLG